MIVGEMPRRFLSMQWMFQVAPKLEPILVEPLRVGVPMKRHCDAAALEERLLLYTHGMDGG